MSGARGRLIGIGLLTLLAILAAEGYWMRAGEEHTPKSAYHRLRLGMLREEITNAVQGIPRALHGTLDVQSFAMGYWFFEDGSVLIVEFGEGPLTAEQLLLGRGATNITLEMPRRTKADEWLMWLGFRDDSRYWTKAESGRKGLAGKVRVID